MSLGVCVMAGALRSVRLAAIRPQGSRRLIEQAPHRAQSVASHLGGKIESTEVKLP